ncbi:hypothetical protein B0T11DRAFT_343693 [Plectosphaerella cucumerina]|uniref:Uncharacterized protein n=1 Tax=Plectosphaerella cucumerina TaxID=40658 RepID=A0A8K0WXX6_9PEZI|nr:hypothetical protein B0T11DRAFT_343693 [Plectosphaerella cucumerina]
MDADIGSADTGQPSDPVDMGNTISFRHVIGVHHKYSSAKDFRKILVKIIDDLTSQRDDAQESNKAIRSFLNFDAPISDADCIKLNEELKKFFPFMVPKPPITMETIKIVHDILRDAVDPQPVNIEHVVRVGDGLDYAALKSFLDGCQVLVKPGDDRNKIKDRVECGLAWCKANLIDMPPPASWQLSTGDIPLTDIQKLLDKCLALLQEEDDEFNDFEKKLSDALGGLDSVETFTKSMERVLALEDSHNSQDLFIEVIRDMIMHKKHESTH